MKEKDPDQELASTDRHLKELGSRNRGRLQAEGRIRLDGKHVIVPEIELSRARSRATITVAGFSGLFEHAHLPELAIAIVPERGGLVSLQLLQRFLKIWPEKLGCFRGVAVRSTWRLWNDLVDHAELFE